jgi:O-antigen ligase
MTTSLSAENPVVRIAFAVLLAAASVYVAARFSGRNALLNIGFWLSVAAFVAIVLGGGVREVVRVFQSRLALAAGVYFVCAGATILIAPAPAVALRDFLPAHGTALVSAVFVACAASRARHARWFLVAVVAGSVLASANQLGAHVTHWRAAASLFPQYEDIRNYGPAHAFFLPAVVALFFFARRFREKALLALVAALEALLLLFAGPRGPWVGVVAAGALSAALTRQWRALTVVVLLLAAAVAVVAALPHSVVKARLEEGLSSSGRITGTWGPAVALIAERPWRGYGYGQRSFAHAFDAAAPRHPKWTERKSLGPHNIYLGAWAAGGPVLLAAMLWLFAEIAAALWRVYAQARSRDLRALTLAALASFVSAYVLHGLFEDPQWLGFGVLLGLALGAHRAVADEARSAPAEWQGAERRVTVGGLGADGVGAGEVGAGRVGAGRVGADGAGARPTWWAAATSPERVQQNFIAFIGLCAALYIAGRYSHKGGLVNATFYLGLVSVALYAIATRGRVLTRLLGSHVALAMVAVLALLAYSIQIAPEPGGAVAAFVKSHGHALLVALVIGCAAAEQRLRPWLFAALVAGAVPEMVRQVGQHWTQWRTSGHWSIQYELVREFGNAYVFYLPACVAALITLRNRAWRAAIWVLAVVQAFLFLLTGFRGAWLGAAAGVLAIALAARSWRVAAGMGAVALVAAATLTLTVPGNVVSERLAKGFDTSKRTEAVWAPGLELARERPFRGYGYGNEVLAQAYERARAGHPEWVKHEWMQRGSWSPHNIYLAMWLRGGFLALAALVWLFVEMVLVFVASARAGTRQVDRALGLAGLGMLVSAYLVHGLFEEKLWPPFGVPLGLALGLAVARRRPDAVEGESAARTPPALGDG